MQRFVIKNLLNLFFALIQNLRKLNEETEREREKKPDQKIANKFSLNCLIIIIFSTRTNFNKLKCHLRCTTHDELVFLVGLQPNRQLSVCKYPTIIYCCIQRALKIYNSYLRNSRSDFQHSFVCRFHASFSLAI